MQQRPENQIRIDNGQPLLMIFGKDGSLRSETKLSPEDVERVLDRSRRWHAQWSSLAQAFYVGLNEGKQNLMLHRFLTDAPKGTHVDHRNHDTLDNRRENLFALSASENLQNKLGARVGSVSGIRNVGWCKAKSTYRVQITFQGKVIHIGYRRDLQEAEQLAIAARLQYFNNSDFALRQK